MEFIDFIMATAIFFIVLVAVFAMVGNNLPNVHLQEDNFTSKNILDSLQNFTDVYYINSSLENTITPYSIANIETTGKSNSLETVSNNTAYGLVYNNSKFYDYNGNVHYTSAGILIKKETFNDYNYQDTFTLNSGDANVNEGTLDLNVGTTLETKDSFSNYNSFLNFKSNDLNVYFNYLDLQNTFLANIQGTNLNVYKIEGSLKSLLTNTTIDNNTWRTLNIKYSNNNLITVSIDNNAVSYQNTSNLKSGNIVIKSIDSNTTLGDFIVFKNTNASHTTNSVATNNLNVTINNNFSSAEIMDGTTNIATMDFNFPNTLTLNQGNIPIITDDQNINRQIVFPDTNEFWSNIKPNEDLKIDLSGLQKNNYDYYIEDDGVNYNTWVKVNIKANKTKTLYIEKKAGYTPNGNKVFDFFDDFDGTSLDTSKWTVTGNDVNISNGVANIYGPTESKGLQSNNTFGTNTVLETRFKSNNSDYNLTTDIGFNWYDSLNYISLLDYSYYNNNYMGFYRKNTNPKYTWLNVNSIDYNKFIIKRINDTNIIMNYKSNIYDYNTEIPTTNMNVVLGSFSSSYPIDFNVDYIFLRKYTSNKPTVIVTDMNSYYKVEITNNSTQDLTNYQVEIPGNDLNISSKSESLLITDNQDLHTNYFSLKGTDPNNTYYVSVNVFDNYNNISKCDINFINNYTTLDINNCDNNSILKFRFGKTLFSYYPETIITKSSESYLPEENIASMIDSNNYYLHLTHQTTDIEKGKKQFNLSKLLERYVNYINANGIEEFAKVIIKPNGGTSP